MKVCYIDMWHARDISIAIILVWKGFTELCYMESFKYNYVHHEWIKTIQKTEIYSFPS